MSIIKSMLLAIISFVLSTSVAGERIAYEKHWIFPSGSEIFFNPKSYRLSDEYNNLTYVLCDDYDDLHKTERNCTVVQDTQPQRTCPVTLKTYNNGEKGDDYLEVFPFGSTKAVIVWPDYREPGSIKCTILDFPTCKSKDVVLDETPYGYSHKFIDSTYFVALDNNSFKIIMPTIARSNSQYSTYDIDAEGNIITKISPWLSKLWERVAASSFRAVVADSKLKAYLESTFESSGNHQRFIITLKKSGGREYELKKFPAKMVNFHRGVESTAHKTIGIAIPFDNRVEVSLFDQEGKLKLNTSVQYHINVESLTLHNSADGGFLLFTVGSKNIKNGPLHPDTYYLTKVDADGKVVGTIKKGAEPACQGKHLSLQAFENEAKESCAVIVCSFAYEGLKKGIRSSSAQLDELVKCFTDEDFSKSQTVD